MFDLDLNSLLKDIVSQDFALVAVVTYFICEAIFAAAPDFADRLKQSLALIVGGILGVLVIPGEQLLVSVLHGILAGAAATTVVARFKKPSSASIVNAIMHPEPPKPTPAEEETLTEEHPTV